MSRVAQHRIQASTTGEYRSVYLTTTKDLVASQSAGTANRVPGLPTERRHCQQSAGTANRAPGLPTEHRDCQQSAGTANRVPGLPTECRDCQQSAGTANRAPGLPTERRDCQQSAGTANRALESTYCSFEASATLFTPHCLCLLIETLKAIGPY